MAMTYRKFLTFQIQITEKQKFENFFQEREVKIAGEERMKMKQKKEN